MEKEDDPLLVPEEKDELPIAPLPEGADEEKGTSTTEGQEAKSMSVLQI